MIHQKKEENLTIFVHAIIIINIDIIIIQIYNIRTQCNRQSFQKCSRFSIHFFFLVLPKNCHRFVCLCLHDDDDVDGKKEPITIQFTCMCNNSKTRKRNFLNKSQIRESNR